MMWGKNAIFAPCCGGFSEAALPNPKVKPDAARDSWVTRRPRSRDGGSLPHQPDIPFPVAPALDSLRRLHACRR